MGEIQRPTDLVEVQYVSIRGDKESVIELVGHAYTVSVETMSIYEGAAEIALSWLK